MIFNVSFGFYCTPFVFTLIYMENYGVETLYGNSYLPVSYTHLDVYKRQGEMEVWSLQSYGVVTS